MPSIPFLRSSIDRDRDRERDASRERLPISPPATTPSRLQQQQQQQQSASSSLAASASTSTASGSAANTPTRSFSDRLLRRKPSLSSKHGTSGSLSGGIPPVPPLSAGLTDYDAGSEPRTASTTGDVFASQQMASSSGSGSGAGLGLGFASASSGSSTGEDRRNGWYGRPADIEVTPLGTYTPQIPDTHPFAARNEVRPPTPSSSKSGHGYTSPSGKAQFTVPSLRDDPPRSTPPPRRVMPTSPTPMRNTPTPESSSSSKGPPSVAEWLNRQPSRGKLRSSSHGSAAPRPPVPLTFLLPGPPPPPLRHKSSPRINKAPDRMSELREQSSTDEGQSGSDHEGYSAGQHVGVGSGSMSGSSGGAGSDGKAYEVSVACTDTDGETKWEVTIRPRPPSTAGVTSHSHTLTPSLGKSTIIAPNSASSINLSLALDQPTGKLVFIQFPTDVSTPSKRRPKAVALGGASSPAGLGASTAFAAHTRQSTFGANETPSRGNAKGLEAQTIQTSPSPARIPVLGAPLLPQTSLSSPEDRPTEPPSLVRPETPPPRMKTPPPLPATPLSDARTPRRGHTRTGSRNLAQTTPARALQYSPPSTPSRAERTSMERMERMDRSDDRVGISTTLNGELVGSPRGATPRRHRIVSASQLNGGLYAPGTVDELSEDLETLVLGGELVPPEERQRTFGGRI